MLYRKICPLLCSTCLASVLFGLFQPQGQSRLGLGFSGRLWKSETCLFPDMTHEMQKENHNILWLAGQTKFGLLGCRPDKTGRQDYLGTPTILL